jgi:hypothetical protein
VTALAGLEEITGASGTAPATGALLPAGVRSRQLPVRTLLLGMMLALADGRPAHLTRVHRALAGLPEAGQRRLGVLADWKAGPHRLTCRQAEYTFGLVTRVLGRDGPAGLPARELQRTCDRLLEASIPAGFKDASASLAVDWTDLETFSRPPPHGTGDCADPGASWGHRKNNLLRDENELFFGYYLTGAVTVPDEHGPPVPELARRMTLSSCRHDPVPAFTPVLTAMPGQGIALGDVLADSGYSHRVPRNWSLPLRLAGAQLVQDLHPNDRGPKGTHDGAVIANGNLYCPCTPPALLKLGPLAPGAGKQQAADHDRRTAEAARCKLGRHAGDDAAGYCRVRCPAAAGKVRCPLRPASMTLDRDRPEILAPPEHPQACCTRQNHHRPPGRERENQAEARLPLRRLAPLLRPPHRRRTRFRHRQRPRRQRHRPRLVPPHGPGTPHAVHHGAASRPQPADPHRLEHPAGRKPAPRRQGNAPQNPQAPPQDPRRPCRRAALTPAPPAPPPPRTPCGASLPGHATQATGTAKRAPPAPFQPDHPGKTTNSPRMSDPNVKLVFTET